MVEINDENFPGNSMDARPKARPVEKPVAEAKPQAKKVVPVTKRKKSLGESFRDTFFGDTAKSVGEYILFEVLVPALKSTVDDMVTGGMHRMLYGDSRADRRDRRDPGRSHIPYNSIYDREDRRREPIRVRSQYDFTDIVFHTRANAQEVLLNLVECIDNYGQASVADFYGFIDMTSEHTDNKYGWKSLGSADVRPVRDGFILLLPNPRPLD